jgi:glycosyltransferase involved in cell wall biosynthesis
MAGESVTVYSAAFNRSGWVGGCVASVEAQDYPLKRMFVVDDHSADDTFGAVVKMMRNPTPLPTPEGAERLVAGQTPGGMNLAVARLAENRGPAGARNWAIQANWNGADVFGNLDSDDRYRPGYLSKMMPLFAHAEVGAVYCDYETVSAAVTVREFKEPFSRKRLFEDCLLCNDSLVHKRAFASAGVYDEHLRVAEDWDLWLRVAERWLILHVPECLLSIHAGPHGSATTVPPERWAADRRRVFEKAAARSGRT